MFWGIPQSESWINALVFLSAQAFTGISERFPDVRIAALQDGVRNPNDA